MFQNMGATHYFEAIDAPEYISGDYFIFYAFLAFCQA